MIHVIAMKLVAPEISAERVGTWLRQTFPSWAQPMPQLWIVDGPLVAEQILIGLDPLLGRDDRLVVIKGATAAAWRGVDETMAGWLADAFPDSYGGRIPGKPEVLTPD